MHIFAWVEARDALRRLRQKPQIQPQMNNSGSRRIARIDSEAGGPLRSQLAIRGCAASGLLYGLSMGIPSRFGGGGHLLELDKSNEELASVHRSGGPHRQ